MADDLRIRRAASIIMWHIRNGHDAETAVLKAQEREPELTDSEMRQAARWALAALDFADMMKMAKPTDVIHRIRDRAGLPKGVKRGT